MQIHTHTHTHTHTLTHSIHARCEAGTPSYDGGHCFDLTAARVGACLGVCLMLAALVVVALLATFVIKLRLEPTMARVAAVFTGAAFLCFLLCAALWAHLVLALSHATQGGSGGGSKAAALSIGTSWVAACGGCLLAFITTLNLGLAARRIDKELVEIGQQQQANRRSHPRPQAGGTGTSPVPSIAIGGGHVQPQPHASKAAPV